jgi:hypothetical protein
MAMRKYGAPANSNVHGVVVANIEQPEEKAEEEAKESDKNKKD